jgi:hypothetical protein
MARDALVVEPLTLRLWPAFEDLLDQGWVEVTPRAVVPALEIPWRLRSVDDVPVVS